MKNIYRNAILDEAAEQLEAFTQDTPAMLLACGEMSASEIRLAKAILKNRAQAIRSLKKSPGVRRNAHGIMERFGSSEHEAVRMVLLAIREPSEGMKEAGSRGGDCPFSEEVWQSMIDAALEEG